MSNAAKKPRLVPNVTVGERGRLSVSEIRTQAMNDPKGFMQKINAAIDKGELTLQSIGNLMGLLQAVGDVQVPVVIGIADGAGGVYERAVMASAFPLLTGGLAVKGIQDAYEAVPSIGQDLVTDFEDNKKVTTMAAIHALGRNGPAGVKEGDPFPEVTASEEKVEIRNKRDGLKLSLTMEAIEENDIADFASRVNKTGEIAADIIEELTLDRICDRNGSAASASAPYAYRPNGAGASLFSTTASTPGTRAPNGTRLINTALVDESDLEAGRSLLSSMRNERGKRIQNWSNGETICLVPDALTGVASKLLNSELVPGVENEQNNWGPRGSYRPVLKSSPKLDDISTSAWYMGRPKRQFKRKWKLRFEYTTLEGNTQAFLDRRIAFQARIAWDCEVGAVDYVYWVQCLAGSVAASAPAAASA